MRIISLCFCFLLLCGFKVELMSQPAEERAVQDSLPKSKDPLWKILAKTKVTFDNNTGLYTAHYTDEIKAMSGKEIEVSGFMMPLEAGEKFTHFMLSNRTPTCFFCPPGEPNEVIDVWTKKPVKWGSKPIKIKGKFVLINNKALGMFFKIENGEEI